MQPHTPSIIVKQIACSNEIIHQAILIALVCTRMMHWRGAAEDRRSRKWRQPDGGSP
jgi:hypothetical protein